MAFPSNWTRPKTLSWLFQVIGRDQKLCHGFSKQLYGSENLVMAFPKNWARPNDLMSSPITVGLAMPFDLTMRRVTGIGMLVIGWLVYTMIPPLFAVDL